jgi:hypothetical protein
MRSLGYSIEPDILRLKRLSLWHGGLTIPETSEPDYGQWQPVDAWKKQNSGV